MAEGFVDFLEFAAAVVLAAPAGLLGFILLTNGDPLGGVSFLVIAVGMVAFDRFIVAPRDLVGKFIADLFGFSSSADDED